MDTVKVRLVGAERISIGWITGHLELTQGEVGTVKRNDWEAHLAGLLVADKPMFELVSDGE